MTPDEADQLYRRMLLELWQADDDGLDELPSHLVSWRDGRSPAPTPGGDGVALMSQLAA